MSGKTSVSAIFEIPKFYYFESGNDYSGSKRDFSYKIQNGKSMKCMTWHGKLCSMKATIENEKEFDRTPEGFAEMIKWLESKYNENKI
ncbi:MAG: hypothetical protein NC205_06860 [Prevotella sp.]|nr:hypothetical protein [Alistipes senegalensis]MCM1358299.1 hypothetical protein [Prevotella sp.]MCM1472910.1 hypothetical protein [Muribaculaceae bacterium]